MQGNIFIIITPIYVFANFNFIKKMCTPIAIDIVGIITGDNTNNSKNLFPLKLYKDSALAAGILITIVINTTKIDNIMLFININILSKLNIY